MRRDGHKRLRLAVKRVATKCYGKFNSEGGAVQLDNPIRRTKPKQLAIVPLYGKWQPCGASLPFVETLRIERA